MRRWWAWASAVGLLLLVLAPTASAAHRPLYKAGVDVLDAGEWEAHFVWLRSDYFNFMGEVWWQVYVQTAGSVDILFLDLPGLQAFADGGAPQPLLTPMLAVPDGSQWISDLSSDLPYFLVLRNPTGGTIDVEWTIFAEVDWRRWQGQPPGPTLDLQTVERSPPLFRNDSWERTFTEPALYVYNCQPHIDMTAILEVVPGDVSQSRVDIDIRDMGFHPEFLRVPVGTTVNWTNRDGLDHSVELRVLEGGFVLPGTAQPGLDLLWGLVAIPAAAAVALLLLRRNRKRSERRSNSKPKS